MRDTALFPAAACSQRLDSSGKHARNGRRAETGEGRETDVLGGGRGEEIDREEDTGGIREGEGCHTYSRNVL